RKKSMNDKDRGNWRYTYTAFGELKTQTDARGIVTTNSYDILGRKTKQTVTGEQTSQWVFGTGNTVHQLMSESIGNE
ncbi:RHS repeat domain-containing protein, partial [Psychrobacter sp. SIMBA_152]